MTPWISLCLCVSTYPPTWETGVELLAHFSKVMRGCTVLLVVNASLVIFVQLWNEELFQHVQIHDTFHARGTIVPIPPPRALLHLKSRWLLSEVCYGSKKQSLLHKCKGNIAISIARNLSVGPQFTPGTRILFRPDFLWAMLSHPVGHVFLALQWNSLCRASFEVHESQRDLRLGKLVFQILLCG